MGKKYSDYLVIVLKIGQSKADDKSLWKSTLTLLKSHVCVFVTTDSLHAEKIVGTQYLVFKINIIYYLIK